MKLENRMKVILLWIVLLFGMMAHSQLAVMPVFFGVDVAIPGAAGSMPVSMGWMCLFFYLVPLLLVVGVMSSGAKWFRITNLMFGGLIALLNASHLCEHAAEVPVDRVQVVLLGWVLIFSIIQCGVSFQWAKEKSPE